MSTPGALTPSESYNFSSTVWKEAGGVVRLTCGRFRWAQREFSCSAHQMGKFRFLWANQCFFLAPSCYIFFFFLLINFSWRCVFKLNLFEPSMKFFPQTWLVNNEYTKNVIKQGVYTLHKQEYVMYRRGYKWHLSNFLKQQKIEISWNCQK